MLNGYNATLFAYGITGTGKSFTIFGDAYKYPRESRSQLCMQKGLSCLIIQELFQKVQEKNRQEGTSFVIKFSYLEIYNENVHDMLSQTKEKSLIVNSDPQRGVVVQNIKEIVIQSLDEARELIEYGNS